MLDLRAHVAALAGVPRAAPREPGLAPAAAVVPARNEARAVAATVAAVRRLGLQDVVVVDDASSDDTAERALAAGARVIRSARHLGKAAAVLLGARAVPAAVLLLLDADLGESAAEGARLLAPVLAGRCDMAVGLLPPSGRRGGLGVAVSLSRFGIRRLTGVRVRAPLSGQRALRREVLAAFRGARGFGLEVALTVDALRAGYRVLEVPTRMAHRVRGLGPADFAHRARQLGDAVWSLAQRSR